MQTRIIALAAAVSAWFAGLSVRAQVPTHLEALSGQPVPGQAAGVVWGGFDGVSIGHDGEINFIGYLLQTAGPVDLGPGIWRLSGGQFSLVVRKGDAAPGAGAGATFADFSPPATRGSDATKKPLGFRALVDVGGNLKSSIWSVPDVATNALTKLALDGELTPGDFVSTVFPVIATSDGSLAFVTVESSGNAAIYDNFSGAVQRRARAFDPVPGVSQGTYSFNGQVLLTMGDADADTGLLAFQSGINDGPNSPDGTVANAIFGDQTGGLGPRFIQFQATNAPGVQLGSMGPPDFVAGGNLAFYSTITGSNVDLSNNEAVFLGPQLLAQKNNAAPESATGELFFHFNRDVIANANEVVFSADLREPAGSFTSRTGLLIAGPLAPAPARIAYEGDQAPGTPAGVKFGPLSDMRFLRVQLNSKSQLAFRATLTGTGVNGTNNIGIWGSLPDTTLVLVARTGDTIEIAPGDERTITGLGFLNGGLPAGPADGRPRALNNSGRLVFTVEFSDGTVGIVRATLGVETKGGSGETSANFVESITAGEPVNTRAGELIDYENTDLDLGGPMPLRFSRYYGSLLNADGNLSSALGRNRLHNFDARLLVTGDTATAVLNTGRVVSFTKTRNTWTLAGRDDIAFQLVESGADFILGDPRVQRLWVFDATGRLNAIEDGRGNIHTLTYDAGRLMTVSDGLGRSLSFAYDGGGQLTSVSDGTRSVAFTYSDGNLATAKDALNRTTTCSYDASGRLLSTQRPGSNSPLSQTYDASGRVMSQTEHPAAGVMQTTSIAYEAATRTRTITDPASEVRVHTYTTTGELAEFLDEDGGSIAFDGDETGRRSAVTAQDGRKTSITYHAASGKPASITNAEGATATFTYKARTLRGLTFYDLVKIVRADKTTRSFTYDAKGNLLSATDPLGKKTTFTYNSRGQLLTRTSPTGGVSTFTYEEAAALKGNLKTSKDGDTGETTYTFDAFSRLTRLTHPGGTHFDIAYDATDRITSLTDERGQTFTYAYDANGNVTGVTDPASQTAAMEYDGLDRLVKVTDRLGRISRRGFDPRDLLASETDGLNHATTLTHDARQQVATVVEPGGAAVGFGYDAAGRLTSITDPLLHTSTATRNALGEVIAVTDARGGTVQFLRDVMQRVTKLIDPIGRQTALAYDKAGRLAGAAREGGVVASYRRDAAGRLVKATDPNRGAWSFTYTPSGRLETSKDPLGRTTALSYNTRGQLQMLTFPDGGTCALERDASGRVTRGNFSGGPDLMFGYDAVGRLVGIDGATFTRDIEGQITNSAQAGQNFGASYDPAGRLATVTYAGALTVTYTYDLNDRLTGVTDTLSGATIGFSYDAAGRLTGVTRSNGVNRTITYDEADRITRIQDGPAADPIDLNFTLNAAGDITLANATAPLLPAVQAGGESFAFDAASQVKTADFAYDARGRLTATPEHTFEWDGATRLVSVGGVTLGYDGFGNVTTRTVGGATTRLFNHHAIRGQPLVAERTELNNTFTRFYVWTPDGQLLYAIDAATNAPSFYHFDRVGSTLALTNAAGAVTDTYAYTPYGESLGHGGTPGASTQPFTFVGAYGVRMEGPLYQMHARYYDPRTGRFLTRDPAPAHAADPRTLDPYLYALGNPTLYIDPDGAAPNKADGMTDKFDCDYLGLVFYRLFVRPAVFGLDPHDSGPNEFDRLSEQLLREFITKLPEFADTSVEMPPLPTQEVFNAELNEVLRKSRELEQELEGISAIAEKDIPPGAEVALPDAPGASELLDGLPSETIADQMVMKAFGATGADAPVMNDAVPISNNRGDQVKRGDKDQLKPSKGPLQLFKEFKKKALKLAAKAEKEKKKKQTKDAKEAEKKKYEADPYSTDPKDALDLGGKK